MAASKIHGFLPLTTKTPTEIPHENLIFDPKNWHTKILGTITYPIQKITTLSRRFSKLPVSVVDPMLSSFPTVALRDSEACNATPTDRMSSGVALAAQQLKKGRSCEFPPSCWGSCWTVDPIWLEGREILVRSFDVGGISGIRDSRSWM